MEKSYFWNCANIGDGGLDSFSQEKVMSIYGMLAVNYDPEIAGVIPWKSTQTTIFETLGLGAVAPTDELEPEYIAGNIVVHSGLGLSGGIFYVNTGDVTFDLAVEKSGLANATDRVVLRRSLVSQTARLVYVQATAPATVAPLTYSSLAWDVPIASIQLNGAGNYSALVDDRFFVTTTLYPPRQQVFYYPAILGENVTDNTVITPSFSLALGLRHLPGIALPHNKISGAPIVAALPRDIVKSNNGTGYRPDFRFIIRNSTLGGSFVYDVVYTTIDETGLATLGGSVITQSLSVVGDVIATPYWSTLSGAAAFIPTDTAAVYFLLKREGTHVSDTHLDNIHVIGVEVLYNAVAGQPDRTRQYINS